MSTAVSAVPVKRGTVVFSPLAMAIFGLILAVINAFQWIVIDASTGVHTAIMILTTTLAAIGATRADAAFIAHLLPQGVTAIIVTLIGVGQALQGLSDIGQTAHYVIGSVLIILTTVFVQPDHTVESDPTASRSRL